MSAHLMNLTLLAALAPASLLAQSVTGTLAGSITDPSGLNVASAEVTITNADTGWTKSQKTDESGIYTFPNVPTGRYNIVVEAAGFKKAELQNVQLSVDQRVRADIQLTVGNVSETIEVTASAGLLQSDSSEVGTTVGETQIRELPLNGRNFVQMTRLIPGVHRGVPGTNLDGSGSLGWRASASFTANGMRARDNNFILDGVDNNEVLLSTVVVYPSPDALQEFKVQTSAYSAEFGRGLGGVVNLQIKSGTNQYHGNLFEFLRNDKLDANDWFNNKFGRPRAPYRQNQFGGTFGGPVVRNRTFFFTDYQGLRVRESRTFLATVPSEAMRQGNFSELNLTIYDPLARSPFPGNQIPSARQEPIATNIIREFYPTPNNSGQRSAIGQPIQNFFYNPTGPRQDDQFDVKMDHILSTKNQFFGRLSYQRSDRFLPAALPGGDAGTTFGAGKSIVDAWSAVFNDTHTIRPNLLNELRLGFNRFALQGIPIGYGENLAQKVGLPGVNISDITSAFTQITFSPGDYHNLGPSSNQPILAYYNTYQALDNIVWVKGRHTVKAGFSFIRRQRSQFNVNQATGQFIFQRPLTSNCGGATTACSPAANTGFAGASFLLGYPTTVNRDTRLGITGEWRNETGTFIQDDFRVNKTLTLNLGLRHEVFTPFAEMHDRQSNFDPVSALMVMASPGARYADGSEAGRTLRNTYYSNFGPRIGFAWSPLGPRMVFRGGYGMFFNSPLTGGSSQMTRNPPFGLTQSVATGLLPTLQLRDGIAPLPAMNPGAPLAGNLGSTFDRELREGRGQNWNFNIQRQLGADYLVEIGYVGSRGTRLLMNQNLNQAPPTIGVTNPDVNRPYRPIWPALRNVTNVQSRGQSIHHAMQLKFTRNFSKNLMFLNSYTWGKTQDIVSDTESATLNAYNHRLDWGLAAFDLRHNFSSSWTWALPFGKGQRWLNSGPALVRGFAGGWEVSSIILLRSGLPFTVTQQQGVLSTGTGNRPDRIASGKLDNPNIDRWFDTSAFRPTAENTGTYGNSGKNILTAPGQAQFDFNIAKNTQITERFRHQFRLELFNAFNRPQFAGPGSSIGTASAGVISSLLFNTPMRQIQMAMKLFF